jgi:hypothetical protein
MSMKLTLNQIENDFNGSIGEIPEDKLKELLNELYYQAYHAVFIDKNLEAEDKALNAINALQDNNDDWKVFRAASDAIVWVPLQILMELDNKKNAEIKDSTVILSSVWYLTLLSNIEFNNLLINHITDCEPGKEKDCLDWIKSQLEYVCEAEKSKIQRDQDSGSIQKVIDYLESKSELPDYQMETLKRLKEGEAL